MFQKLVWIWICVNLIPIDVILCDIICKDSRIDSITYSNDEQKYFFTSGGYYWWLKATEFPPKDSAAKKLPEPFKMGHAAVYIDTVNGCPAGKTQGTSPKPGSKEIWVEELVGTDHKIMVFDTITGNWKPEAIKYNQNHCVSRAQIDWANGMPLDAMFVRNYLQVYFVQDNTYAMVDCTDICKDPDSFGSDKTAHKIADFNTDQRIFAMYVLKNQMLYMFHEKTYWELKIQPDSKDGKLVVIKSNVENHIIKDFMKISTPGQCIAPTSLPNNDSVSGDMEDVKPPEDVKRVDGKGKEESGGSSVMILVIVFIVVVVVIIIGVIAFFAMKPKSGADEEAAKDKAGKGKPGAAAGGGPPKVQPSPKGGPPGKAAKK